MHVLINVPGWCVAVAETGQHGDGAARPERGAPQHVARHAHAAGRPWPKQKRTLRRNKQLHNVVEPRDGVRRGDGGRLHHRLAA
eukprot:1176398-Prorocentrum_minimum.AAC.3